MAEPEPQSEEESPTQTSNDFLHQLGEKYDKYVTTPLLSRPAAVLAIVLSASATGISISQGSLEKSIIFGILTATSAMRAIPVFAGTYAKKDK